jgi:hypothetical protein
MLEELHQKLLAANNFELVAHYEDWYILLRASGTRGRLTCYWSHEEDAVGYNYPTRLWDSAPDINALEEVMKSRGLPLSKIPLHLWHEDPRPDAEEQRLKKMLSEHQKQ